MTEKLLHYIWQFQYFNKTHLRTTGGEKIEIISPGTLNKNQGPDFSNAKIKVGDTLLAGSLELHLKTSDWNIHGHTADPNYRNVILHVVFEDDVKHTNAALPLLELQEYIPKFLLEKYSELMNNSSFIPCSSSISQIKELTWLSWKERLLAERLTRKSQNILQNLEQTNYHWEEVFWRMIARNFGIKVNADAFEQIARSIPVTILAKHKNQIHQLEALLFGQAGLLSEDFRDD
ncbi:MAG: DUF2851 family protein, partial [Chitinophagaceae bacterium]|nr:DUF2851 family protein [Chitinophagaceae bacterium]